VRIFLSEEAAAELRPRIATAFAGRPFEIVTPSDNPADFDAAFVTRDVTGKSTKLHLEPSTQSFHDALRRAKSLRWVQAHSSGTDRPIYQELKARGVTVTTASGSHAPNVAQSALAGILALARKLPRLMEQQRAREWKSLVNDLPRDLAGQTAVIVGWGPIGQLLARWLEAIGLEIIVVRNSSEAAGAYPTWTYAQLREVAPKADWLVIACPISEKTQGLVDRDVLAALPAGAHVVNVGRGEVIVEVELVAALSGGHLAGAFLDVFEHEPLPRESPLWSLPNVIVTPHTAGHSDGNAARVAEIFLDNLARFLPPMA
jgi:phosphoglycerate dehydrogenase-like enzyme